MLSQSPTTVVFLVFGLTPHLYHVLRDAGANQTTSHVIYSCTASSKPQARLSTGSHTNACRQSPHVGPIQTYSRVMLSNSGDRCKHSQACKCVQVCVLLSTAQGSIATEQPIIQSSRSTYLLTCSLHAFQAQTGITTPRQILHS